VQNESADRSQNYASWALPFLADYIVNTHHAYLKENDEQIAAYARKIAGVHGAHHPEVIRIAAIFAKIATDMTAHLKEEEEVFFPALKRADAARIAGDTPDAHDRETIRVSLLRLHREHVEIGDAVHEIRHLSKEYAIPGDVCNTFMVTYQKLKEFEDDLHKHVHLENNILFRRQQSCEQITFCPPALHWNISVSTVVLLTPLLVGATEEYAKETGQTCAACHSIRAVVAN